MSYSMEICLVACDGSTYRIARSDWSDAQDAIKQVGKMAYSEMEAKQLGRQLLSEQRQLDDWEEKDLLCQPHTSFIDNRILQELGRFALKSGGFRIEQ